MYIRTREGLGQAIPTNRRNPEYVRWVQESLNKILGLQLKADGVMGPRTRSAIQSFQRQQGLMADGIVGRKTEATLVKAGSGAPRPIIPVSAEAAEAPRVRQPMSRERLDLQPLCYQLKTKCPALEDAFELNKHTCETGYRRERDKLMCRGLILAHYRAGKERCRQIERVCYPSPSRKRRQEFTQN